MGTPYVGPIVFELGLSDLVGNHLAAFDRVVLNVSLSSQESHRYLAASQVFADARRTVMFSQPGCSYAELVTTLQRSETGRKALLALASTRAPRLLPEARVRAAVDVRARRPRYLGEQDLPWVDSLVEVYRAHAGARRAELDHALRVFHAEQPNAERVRRAITVMDRFVVTRVRASVDPRMIRARLFEPRTPGVSRAAALAQTAQALGLTVDDLARMMFADFARERRAFFASIAERIARSSVSMVLSLARPT